jgi:hypothetical protein
MSVNTAAGLSGELILKTDKNIEFLAVRGITASKSSSPDVKYPR